jgi:hypothetical protein
MFKPRQWSMIFILNLLKLNAWYIDEEVLQERKMKAVQIIQIQVVILYCGKHRLPVVEGESPGRFREGIRE